MSMEGVIFGIENPLLDISAHVPQSLLEKYELKPSNAILAEEKHLPLYEELVKGYPVEYLAGGATQNSMRAVCWLLQQPHTTVFVGCVGKDAYAQKIRHAAEAAGVRALYLEDESTPTGTCAVLIQDKERSMVANLAAANKYKPEHFQSAEVQEAVKKARIYYSSGFFLTVAPTVALDLAKYASAHSDKLYATNLSAGFIVDFFGAQLEAVLAYTDILFGNEDEAAAMGKKYGWGTDLKEIAKKAAALPHAAGRTRTVAFTQGSKPTLVSVGGADVQEFPITPVSKEQIVDTNGAGDSFVGGYLAALALGKSLAESVQAGHYVAGECIKCSGVTFPPKPTYNL